MLINARSNVNKVIKDNINKKKDQDYINCKIISFLTFGSWVTILRSYKQDELIKHIFPYLDSVKKDTYKDKKKETFAELKTITDFRNRCAHHESIIKDNVKAQTMNILYKHICKHLINITDKDYKIAIEELAEELSNTSKKEIIKERDRMFK